MSELSVPSSTLDVFTAPYGTANIAGLASDYWEAVASSPTTKYINIDLLVANPPDPLTGFSATAILYLGMQAVTDPLIDVGYTFRIIVRENHPTALYSNSIFLFAGNYADSGSWVEITRFFGQAFSPDFTEYSVILNDFDIQNFRAAGGFTGNSFVQIIGSMDYPGSPDTNHYQFDIAYVALEVPDSSNPPTITTITATVSETNPDVTGVITGTDFVDGVTVDINGTPVTVVFVSSTTLFYTGVTVLEGDVVSVSVTNPGTDPVTTSLQALPNNFELCEDCGCRMVYVPREVRLAKIPRDVRTEIILLDPRTEVVRLDRRSETVFPENRTLDIDCA